MTPTNGQDRLQKIAEAASGFIYCVARRGVTGTSTDMNKEVADFIAECRTTTDLPLAVGFGINSAKDIKFIGQHADIAVIGTAALKAWESQGERGLRDFFNGLV